MSRLRDPDGGCPWDVEQTHQSIAHYCLEEAYEVVEAINHNDMGELREELGDLLLQVVFHAQMASEREDFTFDDVAGAIADKMIARHPHVFGEKDIASAEAQTTHWEQLKEQERQAKGSEASVSALDNIPLAFPALLRAQKLGKRASRVGFDWPNIAPVFDKIEEELNELREAAAHGSQNDMEEELGDLLFAVVNLARHQKIDAESALRGANAKFESRFRYIEETLRAQGKDIKESSLEEMEDLWNQAKEKAANAA